MAISYVNDAGFSHAGVGGDDVCVGVPVGVRAGDLLVCGFGNVSSQLHPARMVNGWTKVEEVGADGSNCFFLTAAKIATSVEVAAAGRSVQVAALRDTTGQTNRSSKTMVYRGTAPTVNEAIAASSSTHVTWPSSPVISTGSVFVPSWYVYFFNMRAPGVKFSEKFAADAGVIRSPQVVSFNETSTTSICCAGDSDRAVTPGDYEVTGTWPGVPYSMNATIVAIQ